MKTQSKILFVLSLFFFSSFSFPMKSTAIQDINTVEGVFDGQESYGYNFIAIHPDDDSEYTITFQNINKELLNQFDLGSEALIGKSFKITYQIKIKKTKDEDGFVDEEEILTITNLEKL
ncbi:hypothetical protein ACS386_04450 [Flavobacteriaceae bacterium LMO-SS05]|jgi:hypothetical protein